MEFPDFDPILGCNSSIGSTDRLVWQCRETVYQFGSRVLAQQGIILHSHVAEEILIRNARTADFAVIPAGTLDGNDTHDWLARASLPSRIVYLMATANVPMIVMGHRETAAARFVTELGLGTVCEYSAISFQNAVTLVTSDSNSAAIRARARDLSPRFSSRDLSSWIWDSLSHGQPIDNRLKGFCPYPL